MSSSNRMLKTLTYEEKAAVIRKVENGFKIKSLIAKEFGIPPNTLSTYLKNKETILNKLATSSVKGRKRTREPENPDVDECVYKWFKQTRDKKIPLSGLLIRAKAEEFPLKLGNGWLDGFKERNGICFKIVSSESGDVNVQEADDWKIKLLQMIKSKNPKNICNAGKTGLFYRCTPDKTLAFKGERCSGGKQSKERVTR
jgi:hypothetical protein